MDFSFRLIMIHHSIIPCIVFLMLSCCNSWGQEVEHNYLVGPQNTNCDSLNLQNLSFLEVKKVIERTVFRFDQNFKISRTSGVRAGHFYSCDGQTGFLILTIGKGEEIYFDVPRSLWDEFTKTTDFDGFFKNNIREQYPLIRELSP